MLHLTLSLGLAADHYSPSGVARASTTFARYAEALGPQSDALEERMAISAKAVQELDLAVNLLGGGEHAEWRAEVRKTYAHQGLEAQSFSDWIQDASESVFTQAMEMAIQGLGVEVVECASRAGGIASITGPMGGSSSACEGADQSAAIAKAMDANTQLSGVVDQLLAESWPTLELPQAAQPVTSWTGSADYIRFGAVAKALIGDDLEAIEATLERDLGDLDRELESGDADKALEEATKHRLAYEATLAKEGEALLEALAKPSTKAGYEVGLCVNPPALGGCEGTDVTREFLAWAREDKKVLKALD